MGFIPLLPAPTFDLTCDQGRIRNPLLLGNTQAGGDKLLVIAQLHRLPSCPSPALLRIALSAARPVAEFPKSGLGCVLVGLADEIEAAFAEKISQQCPGPVAAHASPFGQC